MAGKVVEGLKAKTDAAWANLTRQLQGMEPHLESSDAPGEWTTRQVLCHLLLPAGWDPVATFKRFSDGDLQQVDVEGGQTYVTDERRRMSLKQLVEALDAQRQAVYRCLGSLADTDLERRRARIPLFKQYMGTDEIPLARYIGAMWDFHWNNHAGQVAKIRKTVGLPEAR